MDADLRQQLIVIFSDIFQVELAPDVQDVTADEIDSWDSVNKLRLVLEIEQVFDVSLDDAEVVELASLRDAEALLRLRGANGPSGARSAPREG